MADAFDPWTTPKPKRTKHKKTNWDNMTTPKPKRTKHKKTNWDNMTIPNPKTNKDKKTAKKKGTTTSTTEAPYINGVDYNQPKDVGELSPANITGQPDITTEQNMWGGNYNNVPTVERMYVQLQVHFWSQYGEEYATYTLGRDDDSVDVGSTQSGLHNELLGFKTTNDINEDCPTFQIQLSGLRDWDDVLVPNDYVEINARSYHIDAQDISTPNETEGEQATDSDHKTTFKLLMSGLISDIGKSTDVDQGRGYLVTGKGVQKILENIHIGAPSDVLAYGGFFLYDLSAPQQTGSESDPDGDGDGVWNGSVPKSTNAMIKKIAKSVLAYGEKYHVLPSLCIADAWQESHLGSDPNSSVGAGLGTHNLWGLEGSDVGHGMTHNRAHDAIFKDYDEGTMYWMSAMGRHNPGVKYWGAVNTSLRNVKTFNEGVDKLTHSNYMRGKFGYAGNMKWAYKHFNLSRFDKKMSWK